MNGIHGVYDKQNDNKNIATKQLHVYTDLFVNAKQKHRQKHETYN